MLIEEVLFSLYDRSQNYSKRGVLNFGKEIKTILPALLMEKKASSAPPISPLRGFKETNSFSFVGQMECFFQSPGRRNQNGGKFYFSYSNSTL